MNAFDAVLNFEAALCEYTGAKYAITTTRCCMALQMCCEYLKVENVSIPRFTYRGVPQAILRGGGLVSCHNRSWRGGYNLDPYAIWDFARRFTSGMYVERDYQCVSFHRSKPLGFTQGGAILCDDPTADKWFRRWRRDGAGVDDADIGDENSNFDMIGNFAYMDPGTAAELHARLYWFKLKYPGGRIAPNSVYPDLSKTDWNGIWEKQRARS